MNAEDWGRIQDRVTQEMLEYTRPFVSPLTTETAFIVRLVGTGSYVTIRGNRLLLTCEHVAREQPIHYRFRDNDNVFSHPGPWQMERHPIDAAVAPMEDRLWNAVPHASQAVPFERFAERHQPFAEAELLFFRGFAGENADYGFGVHQANGTGYCSQEVVGSGDAQQFEMFWRPQNARLTTQTSDAAKANMRFSDAHGFSGSLVWNTRFLEIEATGVPWTPQHAVITGLLRRWDPNSETLLVWRVEHLRAWLRKTTAT